MATNYDPKVNRYRNIRFRNPSYPTMKLEGEARSLNAEEYKEIHDMKSAAKRCVASCFVFTLASQWLLARLPLFQRINGYGRTISRLGIVLLPTGYARYYNTQRINARYDELLTGKLTEIYENPLSMNYPSY